MNDYFSGELGRQRRDDYQHEAERAALVAEARRGGATTGSEATSVPSPRASGLRRIAFRVPLGALLRLRPSLGPQQP